MQFEKNIDKVIVNKKYIYKCACGNSKREKKHISTKQANNTRKNWNFTVEFAQSCEH